VKILRIDYLKQNIITFSFELSNSELQPKHLGGKIMQIPLMFILISIGIIMIILEIFIPGGVVGVLGGVLLFIGIIVAFTNSIQLGIYLLVISLILLAFIFHLWVKYFPNSKHGKVMFLSTTAEGWHAYQEENQTLLNQEGVAISNLRPAGIAIINKQRVDVITRGDMILKNSKIKIIQVSGNRLVVEKIS